MQTGVAVGVGETDVESDGVDVDDGVVEPDVAAEGVADIDFVAATGTVTETDAVAETVVTEADVDGEGASVGETDCATGGGGGGGDASSSESGREDCVGKSGPSDMSGPSVTSGPSGPGVVVGPFVHFPTFSIFELNSPTPDAKQIEVVLFLILKQLSPLGQTSHDVQGISFCAHLQLDPPAQGPLKSLLKQVRGV